MSRRHGRAVPPHQRFQSIEFDRLVDAYRAAAALRAIDDVNVFEIWVEETDSVSVVWVPRATVRGREALIRDIVATFGRQAPPEESAIGSVDRAPTG